MVLHVALSMVMAAIGSCPKKNLIGRGEGGKKSQKGLSIVVILLIINASIYVLWPDIMCKFSLFGFWRKALWSLPYGLLRARTVHLRWLTALIEVKPQNLLKVEACIIQPRLLLFCPLFPNSLLYPMDYTVIRHLVLMSFPYGRCNITFTVAVRVACKFTSPFTFLPMVEWMHTCTNIWSHGLSDQGSKAVKLEETSPLFRFSAGGPLRRKGKKNPNSSIGS